MKSFKQFLMESPQKIIAYHYTHSVEFDHFEQLSHFGTLNAATTMSVNSSKRKDGEPRILEVELTFNKLFRLTYAEEEDDAKLHRAVFVDGKYPELKKVWTKDTASSIQALKKLGVDGIVYSNDYDDDGSDSYIIFYPEQAKILKVLKKGKRAIRAHQRKQGWED